MLAVLGLVTERATELLHSSKFFQPLRDFLARAGGYNVQPPAPLPPVRFRDRYGWLFTMRVSLRPFTIWFRDLPPDDLPPVLLWTRLARFFSRVLSCGYCTSVWVAMVFAPALRLAPTPHSLVNLVIKVVLLHGVSNWLHELYQRLDVTYVVAPPVQQVELGVTLTLPPAEDENV